MDEQSKQQNRYIILIICFVWFVSVLFFLIYAASQNLVAFDPDGKLWQASQQDEFDTKVLRSLNLTDNDKKSTVIHFSQPICECNPVAKEHIESVEQLADQHNFENISIDLSEHKNLLAIIPSTPAVAVIDAEGKLSYLGPYSAGYACTVGNGIVESYISGQVATMLGAAVISDTEGCYCNAPS